MEQEQNKSGGAWARPKGYRIGFYQNIEYLRDHGYTGRGKLGVNWSKIIENLAFWEAQCERDAEKYRETGLLGMTGRWVTR